MFFGHFFLTLHQRAHLWSLFHSKKIQWTLILLFLFPKIALFRILEHCDKDWPFNKSTTAWSHWLKITCEMRVKTQWAKNGKKTRWNHIFWKKFSSYWNPNPGFVYLQYRGEMDWWQVEQGFSSFFEYFFLVIYDGFAKWSSPKVLWNFKKSSNVAKNWQKMKKSLVQLAFNPLFGWFLVPENWISCTHSTTIKATLLEKNFKKPRWF